MKQEKVILRLCLVLVLLLLALATAYADPPGTERVSVDSVGNEATGGSYRGGSYHSSISADGRYVVFDSEATNLVANDTNGREDVFVHDRTMGQTTRVSVDSSGAEGNSSSNSPSISAEGRYVAFGSLATNLVTGDTNEIYDIFVHDLQTNTTTRVSVDTAGGDPDGESYAPPAISADGRYVAFASWATNLVPNDTNGVGGVFVHDRDVDGNGIFDEPGQVSTTRVSVATGGAQATGNSDQPSISAEGRYVAFRSEATNLVANDTNGQDDVFVHDRDVDENGIFDEPGQVSITRVSVATGGAQATGGDSWYTSISADGRYVAFASWATNLVPNDTNGVHDIFVHDRQTGQTTRVSVDSAGAQATGNSYDPAISADGRYVAFQSLAANLVADDTNGRYDIFVHDRQTEQTTRVSVDSAGAQATGGNSGYPAISADGRHVAFASWATNLVPNDTNGYSDVFVRSLGDPPLWVRPSEVYLPTIQRGHVSTP